MNLFSKVYLVKLDTIISYPMHMNAVIIIILYIFFL